MTDLLAQEIKIGDRVSFVNPDAYAKISSGESIIVKLDENDDKVYLKNGIMVSSIDIHKV